MQTITGKEVDEVEVLKEAHKIVLNGWVKRAYTVDYPYGGVGHCADGAIRVALLNLYGEYRDAWISISDTLASFVPEDRVHGVNTLVYYNDHDDTTLADISDLFLDAIEWLEEI